MIRLVRLLSRWFFSIPPHLLINSLPWKSWQTGFSWSRNWHQKVISLQPLSSQLWSLLPDHQNRQRVLSRVLSGTMVLRIDLVVKKFTCVEKSMNNFCFWNHRCPRCGICPNRPVLVFLKVFIPSMSLIIYIRYDRPSILYAISLVGARTFSLKCLLTFPPGL